MLTVNSDSTPTRACRVAWQAVAAAGARDNARKTDLECSYLQCHAKLCPVCSRRQVVGSGEARRSANVTARQQEYHVALGPDCRCRGQVEGCAGTSSDTDSAWLRVMLKWLRSSAGVGAAQRGRCGDVRHGAWHVWCAICRARRQRHSEIREEIARQRFDIVAFRQRFPSTTSAVHFFMPLPFARHTHCLMNALRHEARCSAHT